MPTNFVNKNGVRVVFTICFWIVLSSCSTNAFWNEHMETTEHPKLQRSDTRPNVASLNVLWELDENCRGYKTNILRDETEPLPERCKTDEKDDIFLGVSFSGGGSRAMIFSAAVLFELQRLGIDDDIDVISAVSGGAITAGLYGASCTPVSDGVCKDDECECKEIERKILSPSLRLRPTRTRVRWTRESYDVLSRDYMTKWLFNRFFWPDNILRATLTAYDSTDVLAETFQDNLFDQTILGGDSFKFRDLNPSRPNLVINATNNTSGSKTPHFTFTYENFASLCSSISTYDVSRALAASSAYPGAFSYSTLANFAPTVARNGEDQDKRNGEDQDKRTGLSEERTKTSVEDNLPPIWEKFPNCPSDDEVDYVHVFDGGTTDNLGLIGLHRSLLFSIQNRELPKPRKVVIFIVDAQNDFSGRNRKHADPREFYDKIILDTNFLDAYDPLMHRTYLGVLNSTLEGLQEKWLDDFHYYHLPLYAFSKQNWLGYDDREDDTFTWGRNSPDTMESSYPGDERRSRIWRSVSNIQTGYTVTKDEIACLREAAYWLIGSALYKDNGLATAFPDIGSGGIKNWRDHPPAVQCREAQVEPVS